MKKRISGNKKIYFKRWINKSWAVFRSVQKVVHILRLKVALAAQSILKHEACSLDSLSLPFSTYRLAGDMPDGEIAQPVEVQFLYPFHFANLTNVDEAAFVSADTNYARYRQSNVGIGFYFDNY